MFARPFLCGLEGHRDSIVALAKFPTRLAHVLSAASDGEVRFGAAINNYLNIVIQSNALLYRPTPYTVNVGGICDLPV